MTDPIIVMHNYHATHPEQRMGQAYFNAIHEKWPAIANQVRSTTLDPFYDDGKLSAFVEFVYEKRGSHA